MKWCTLFRGSGLGDLFNVGGIASKLKEMREYTHFKGMSFCRCGSILDRIFDWDETETILDQSYYNGSYKSGIKGDFLDCTYENGPNGHIQAQMMRRLGFNWMPNMTKYDFSGINIEDPSEKIVVSPEVGSYTTTKVYPYWETVINSLKKQGIPVVVVGSCNLDSIHKQTATVSRAGLFLGCVSYFSHVAGHYSVPGITINAGYEHESLASYSSLFQFRSNSVTCAPCYRRDCPKSDKMKCVRDIPPELVVKKALELYEI